MKITYTLTKSFFSLLLSVSIISCQSSDGKRKDQMSNNDSAKTTNTAPAEAKNSATPNAEMFKDFDWSTVTQSTADIGVFPYLTAPEGLYISEKDSYGKSKTGYSTLEDYNMLIIFQGQSFYKAEGKVAKMKFRMVDTHTEFNQYGFDSSIDKYLLSIGAKLIGKLKLTHEQASFLNQDDDMTIHHHIIGDPYNVPVRFYALNHHTGKMMFQVFSNTSIGEAAVVLLTAFEQTIKAPTAQQMKKDLDADGKAILNVNFDTDKTNLLSDGQKVVDEILALMKSNPDLKIAIEGHTDDAGSADHNKKLSADRANTILKFLTTRGIAAARLTSAGFGSERPLVANNSELNKAKNRRVELIKK